MPIFNDRPLSRVGSVMLSEVAVNCVYLSRYFRPGSSDEILPYCLPQPTLAFRYVVCPKKAHEFGLILLLYSSRNMMYVVEVIIIGLGKYINRYRFIPPTTLSSTLIGPLLQAITQKPILSNVSLMIEIRAPLVAFLNLLFRMIQDVVALNHVQGDETVPAFNADCSCYIRISSSLLHVKRSQLTHLLHHATVTFERRSILTY